MLQVDIYVLGGKSKNSDFFKFNLIFFKESKCRVWTASQVIEAEASPTITMAALTHVMQISRGQHVSGQPIFHCRLTKLRVMTGLVQVVTVKPLQHVCESAQLIAQVNVSPAVTFVALCLFFCSVNSFFFFFTNSANPSG